MNKVQGVSGESAAIAAVGGGPEFVLSTRGALTEYQCCLLESGISTLRGAGLHGTADMLERDILVATGNSLTPAEMPGLRTAFQTRYIGWNHERQEGDSTYKNGTLEGMWQAWKGGAAYVRACARDSVPRGYTLVPLRMNAEMRRVTEEEGWEWEDILSAAGAITPEQYEEIVSAPERSAVEQAQAVVSRHFADDPAGAARAHAAISELIVAAFPVLTEAHMRSIAVNYGAFVRVGEHDITKFDCEEDFYSCVRAILAAAPRSDELVTQHDSEAWEPITAPGQVAQGDELRFSIGDEEFRETVKEVLNPGTDREELVYNTRRNYYLITSRAMDNTGNHRNVRVLRATTMAALSVTIDLDDLERRYLPAGECVPMRGEDFKALVARLRQLTSASETAAIPAPAFMTVEQRDGAAGCEVKESSLTGTFKRYDADGREDPHGVFVYFLDMLEAVRIASDLHGAITLPHSAVNSGLEKLDWCARMLRSTADRGRAQLGDGYPEVLQVLGAVKRVMWQLGSPETSLPSTGSAAVANLMGSK